MDLNTHDLLAQTQRHGYAVFSSGDVLIGWTLTLDLALSFPDGAYIVNVQNDAVLRIP